MDILTQEEFKERLGIRPKDCPEQIGDKSMFAQSVYYQGIPIENEKAVTNKGKTREYVIRTDAEFRIVDGKLMAVHDGSGVHVSMFKELPAHGRLIDADSMIEAGKGLTFPMEIRSTAELADYLKVYVDLDETDSTVILEASEGN